MGYADASSAIPMETIPVITAAIHKVHTVPADPASVSPIPMVLCWFSIQMVKA